MPAEELTLIIGAVALSAVVMGIAAMFLKKKRKSTHEGVVLLIKVSQTNERGPLAAEQMFASLHGILQSCGYYQESTGSQEHLSFEIASVGGSIQFYVWVPTHLRHFVEGQIYAQYPDVEIFEEDDYTRNIRKDSTIAATELTMTKHEVLPIKEYEEMEEQLKREALDSLASITESMSKQNSPDDQVWIQVLCKPIKDRWWQRISIRTAEALKNGRKPLRFDKTKNLCALPILPYVLSYPFRIFLFPLKLVQLFMDSSTVEDDVSSNSGGGGGSIEHETLSSAIMEKATKLGYRATIRIAYVAPKTVPFTGASMHLRGVAGSFKQFSTAHLNGLKMSPISKGKSMELIRAYRKRQFLDTGMLLNVKELASVIHLPNISVKTPAIVWVTSTKLEPPNDLPTIENTDKEDLTLLGETNFRGVRKEFGIRNIDRRRHVYVIGKTGMGKSTLLENMIRSDIEAGKGVGVIDPHGDLADAVLRFVPKWRTNDVIMFDPNDYEYPVSLNLLESVSEKDRSKVASGFVGIFKKMFGNSWGPRLEHILRNTILALLEYPDSSILGVMRILVDEDYRKKVVDKVTDPNVRSFWVDEFAAINPRNIAEVISPIQNKVGQFLSSSMVRNILGQSHSTINIREAMDTKKILIVNLSKGNLGEDMSKLLGSMLVTKFQMDAMSRADIPEKDRVDFNLYIDEFQNFATESFESILSEARKYRLSLTIANQFIAQLEKEEASGVKEAVFGNVGTIATFSTGAEDAEFLARQFGFEDDDASYIVGLDKYSVYLRLLIDNIPTPTFSARTLAPPEVEDPEEAERQAQNVIRMSRERYAKPRAEVEARIAKWSIRDDKPKYDDKKVKKEKKKEDKPVRPDPIPEIDITSLKKGQLIDVVITGMTNYGLFVVHRGIQGLVHASELPHKKILKPRYDVLHKEDPLKVVVVEVADGKIVLTIKPEKLEGVTKDPKIIKVIDEQWAGLVSKFNEAIKE